MKEEKLTDSELLVLGLVAEMPRHGYQLEQVIKERGMREWTQIGFSSIYFVLGKLEKAGLIKARKPAGVKAKKIFKMTEAGYKTLVEQTLVALSNVRPTYSSSLLGMAHWPVLDRNAALGALRARGAAIEAELKRVEDIQYDKQPLPDFVEAIFDFSLSQLRAEQKWITRTLDYMNSKSWTD